MIYVDKSKSKKRKKVICPRCTSLAITLYEDYTCSISFTTNENGIWDGEEGNKEFGEVTGVRARCSCGYIWKLRGINQITDLTD